MIILLFAEVILHHTSVSFCMWRVSIWSRMKVMVCWITPLCLSACGGYPSGPGWRWWCVGSHFCVFLHVEGVHLVQDEGDGVLDHTSVSFCMWRVSIWSRMKVMVCWITPLCLSACGGCPSGPGWWWWYVGSHLCVFLHVEGVHLVQDEGDGMLDHTSVSFCMWRVSIWSRMKVMVCWITLLCLSARGGCPSGPGWRWWCAGSHLCIFLHVEGVHLVQDEGDGVLDHTSVSFCMWRVSIWSRMMVMVCWITPLCLSACGGCPSGPGWRWWYVGSHLCVFLHVEGVHLVQDEGDGVLDHTSVSFCMWRVSIWSRMKVMVCWITPLYLSACGGCPSGPGWRWWCVGSHLCVFLHVEGVHLVQDEGDGVLDHTSVSFCMWRVSIWSRMKVMVCWVTPLCLSACGGCPSGPGWRWWCVGGWALSAASGRRSVPAGCWVALTAAHSPPTTAPAPKRQKYATLKTLS